MRVGLAPLCAELLASILVAVVSQNRSVAAAGSDERIRQLEERVDIGLDDLDYRVDALTDAVLEIREEQGALSELRDQHQR